MYETPFRSQITEPVLELAESTFSFNSEQMAALEGLFDQHRQRFEEFVEKHRAVKERFDQDVEALEPATLARHQLEVEREITFAKVADEQAEIDQHFFEDLQILLNEDQRGEWARFVESFNRMRWGHIPRVYLEQPIDLVAIIQSIGEESEIDLTDSGFRETLTDYSMRMNRALVNLAQYHIRFARTRLRRNQDRIRTDGERVWLSAFVDDPGALWRERLRLREHHQAVRDVNRRFYPKISALLPEPVRRVFDKHYMRQVLPANVIRDIQSTEILLHRVSRLEDLSAQQISSIDGLSAQYQARVHALNRTILRADDERGDSRFDGTSPARRKSLEEVYDKAVHDRIDAEHDIRERVLFALDIAQRTIVTDQGR